MDLKPLPGLALQSTAPCQGTVIFFFLKIKLQLIFGYRRIYRARILNTKGCDEEKVNRVGQGFSPEMESERGPPRCGRRPRRAHPAEVTLS